MLPNRPNLKLMIGNRMVAEDDRGNRLTVSLKADVNSDKYVSQTTAIVHRS